MPVCGNYLFFELPKKIVLNPKDGYDGFFFIRALNTHCLPSVAELFTQDIINDSFYVLVRFRSASSSIFRTINKIFHIFFTFF